MALLKLDEMWWEATAREMQITYWEEVWTMTGDEALDLYRSKSKFVRDLQMSLASMGRSKKALSLPKFTHLSTSLYFCP